MGCKTQIKKLNSLGGMATIPRGPSMLSNEEVKYILQRAYVPEHIPSLMVGISGGEAFLQNGFVLYTQPPWMIFIGYPLSLPFEEKQTIQALEKAMETFHPQETWYIGPVIPDALASSAQEMEQDEYFRLDLAGYDLPKELKRAVQRGQKGLSIERSRRYLKEHADLTLEFLERGKPPPRIRELFLRMDRYIAHSPTSLLLSARTREGKLSAFYVLELAAENFSTYVVGAHSKKNYVSHASDLLFYDMVNLSQESRKSYIHLGLGVNEGIRRFKKKWGGVPFLSYRSCKISKRTQSPLTWLWSFGNR